MYIMHYISRMHLVRAPWNQRKTPDPDANPLHQPNDKIFGIKSKLLNWVCKIDACTLHTAHCTVHTRWLWNCDGLRKPPLIEKKKQQQQQQPSWKIREQTFQGGKVRAKEEQKMKWNERIVLNHHAHYIHFKSGHTLTTQVHIRAHTNRLHTLKLSSSHFICHACMVHSWNEN